MSLGEELAPGLWRWTREYADWSQPVSSHAVVGAGERDGELVLIDPLLEGADDWRALDGWARGRDLHVLLTTHWHARSAAEVLVRHPAARVWAHARNRAAVARRVATTDLFRPGDPLPGGLAALPARPRGEIILWEPRARALIAGDALVSDLEPPGRLATCRPSWLPASSGPAELRAALRTALDLPVGLVLPSHGPPILAGAAGQLAQALAEPS